MAKRQRKKPDPRLNSELVPALLLQIVDYLARIPEGGGRRSCARWLGWYLRREPSVPGEVTSGLTLACADKPAAIRQLRQWTRTPPVVEDSDTVASSIRAIHGRVESALDLLNSVRNLASAFASTLPTPAAYEDYWHRVLRDKVCEARARARFVRQCPSCGELFAVQSSRMGCCTKTCTDQKNYADRKQKKGKRPAEKPRRSAGVPSVEGPAGANEAKYTRYEKAVDVVDLMIERHGEETVVEKLGELFSRAMGAAGL